MSASWSKRFVVALLLLWLGSWYLAWFDHDDCLGALRQIGGIDDALYRSLIPQCARESERLRLIETGGWGALALSEATIWWSFVHRPRR